ncbi:MAG: DUF1795 domain-containing protein [Thermomicrobia bacterium]|nr:DUF1795 domain-containing protein [Thermomicrobia bacterium]
MRRWLLSTTLITLFAVVCTAAPLDAAASFANPAFQTQWQQGEAITPNFWGPLASAGPGQQEPYVEAMGSQRPVQYFDKGRMELTNGTVTNGLLATDIVRGQIQVGNNAFQPKSSPAIPMAGDLDNPSPTYAQLSTSAASLLASTPTKPGTFVTVMIDASGNAMDGGGFAGISMTPPIGAYDSTTQHNILGVFADYRANVGLAAIGLAISEPFRANVKVAGQQRTVLVQVFERRVLTYTSSNDPPFQVEMGNIGAHFYLWRYGQPLSSVQSAPTATGGTVSSGTLPPLQDGTPYRDQFGRFTTRYPAGWGVNVDSDRNVNFLAPQAPPAAGINVSPRPVTDDVTLDTYRQNDYDYLLPRLKDYRQISDTKIMVGPYPGYKRVFTHTNDEGQFEEIVRYHIRVKGYVIVVNCFTAPQDEGRYMPLFDGTTGAIEPLGP